MKSQFSLKVASAACVVSLFQAYSAPSYSQDAADAPSKVLPETFHLPSVEATGPSIFIKFRFPGKENASRIDIAEHFENRMFRLFENGEVMYGLYAFEGDPLKDEKFTAYYMNFPHGEEFPITFFQFDFDSKARKFKEFMVGPDGKRILLEGTFEIAADKQ
jgi:hypothetical protein